MKHVGYWTRTFQRLRKKNTAMANAPQYDAAPSRPLSRGDIKILSLSALGGALEFYDFIIFVYFATVVGQLFFPPEMPEWLRQIQTFCFLIFINPSFHIL